MKKINILCSDCKGWIWLSPIGIWMTFVFGIFFLPEKWYGGTNLTEWIQAISSALTLLVAWFALSSWKNQVKHRHIESCILELFEINEHFKSLTRVIDAFKAHSIDENNYPKDELKKNIYDAGLNFFKLHLKYKRSWILSGLSGVLNVSECHPDKIKELNSDILEVLSREVHFGIESSFHESTEEFNKKVDLIYNKNCKSIEYKLNLLENYYIGY